MLGLAWASMLLSGSFSSPFPLGQLLRLPNIYYALARLLSRHRTEWQTPASDTVCLPERWGRGHIGAGGGRQLGSQDSFLRVSPMTPGFSPRILWLLPGLAWSPGGQGAGCAVPRVSNLTKARGKAERDRAPFPTLPLASGLWADLGTLREEFQRETTSKRQSF